MAQLKDAEVLFMGLVVDVVKVDSRENPGTTDHYKLSAMVPGGGGFAVVKVTTLDMASNPGLLASLEPGLTRIAWYIRNAAYSIDTNSGMSTRFVRVATADDLNAIATLLSKPSAAQPAKAAA